MGTEVGRIEKEFVFKSLVDDKAPCDVHGSRREVRCRFAGVDDATLTFTPEEGTLEGFSPGDDVRVFSGHGPATTLGDERRANPFVGEEPRRGRFI